VPVVRSKAPRRIVALCVAASATVLVAAACSNSSGAAGGSGSGSGAGGNNAFTAYTDCLKKNGVTVTIPTGAPRNRPSGEPRPSGAPRPSGSAGQRGGGFPGGGQFAKPAGVDDATWQKAQAACASVRPSGRPGGGGNNGANAAYRNCLSDHGVTLGQGLSTSDPTVAKAMETCKVLRPTATPTA
jgi:hypothetical protein